MYTLQFHFIYEYVWDYMYTNTNSGRRLVWDLRKQTLLSTNIRALNSWHVLLCDTLNCKQNTLQIKSKHLHCQWIESEQTWSQNWKQLMAYIIRLAQCVSYELNLCGLCSNRKSLCAEKSSWDLLPLFGWLHFTCCRWWLQFVSIHSFFWTLIAYFSFSTSQNVISPDLQNILHFTRRISVTKAKSTNVRNIELELHLCYITFSMLTSCWLWTKIVSVIRFIQCTWKRKVNHSINPNF